MTFNRKLDEGKGQGRVEGRKKEIFESVAAGDYSVVRGIEELGVSEEEFISEMESAGYLIPKSWDPDFTKLTPSEKIAVDEADMEMRDGIFLTDGEVWK